MRIGIDARSQGKKLTGIGYYVHEMIRLFLEIDKRNEYY